MPEQSPHRAFRDAHRFVRSYLEQIDRLLSDVTELLGKGSPAWRRLRPVDSYIGESKLGQSGKWMLDSGFAFYAPAEAFPNAKYGVPVSKVSRVAFVGAVLAPRSEEDPPELYIGWVENYSGAPGNETVENRLKGIFDHLDPEILVDSTAREIVESIEMLKWHSPCAVTGATSGYERIRISLRRVPLNVIRSRDQLESVIAAFRRALGEDQSS